MGETEIIAASSNYSKRQGCPQGQPSLGFGRYSNRAMGRRPVVNDRRAVRCAARDRALKFIEETAAQQREHTKGLQSVCSSIEAIHDTQKEHGQLLVKIMKPNVRNIRRAILLSLIALLASVAHGDRSPSPRNPGLVELKLDRPHFFPGPTSHGKQSNANASFQGSYDGGTTIVFMRHRLDNTLSLRT